MNDDRNSKANSSVDSPLLVHTTCASRDEAERLAAAMVEGRWAACASVGQPVVSIYPWEGRIERDTEIPLTLKTTRSRFGALRDQLCERHSYDVPELLAVEVVDGNGEYVAWLRDWVSGGDDA